MQYYAQHNRQFEADILTIGCIAGVLRMVIAIYRDLPMAIVNLDFVVDCSLFVVFLLPLLMMRFRVKFERIAIPFSFLVLGFLCVNWIILDGLRGTGEYYFIGGIIMMALIHNNNWLVFFVTLCVLLEVALLLLATYRTEWMVAPNPDDLGNQHYLWVTIVVTIALLYHKNQFDLKHAHLQLKRESMENKIETLHRQNIQLEEQKAMLQKSNEWLESNINQRSEKLIAQSESIERYLSVTLFEIHPYLDSTLASIKRLDPGTKQSQIGNLLLESAEHLQTAIKSVTNKIKKGIYYNPEN